MAEPLIDPETFAALGEMAGPEFVCELVGTFLEEAPLMLAEIHGACAAHDVERFRRNAHSLKSNSDTFGATRLAIAARDLELGGVESASPAALASLDADYARAVAALQALCDG